MNITFFNRTYYPDPEATGQFLADLAEDLSEHGHTVSVVAGRGYYNQSGKSWKPVRFLKQNGVHVARAYNTKFSKKSFLLRLVNLATYSLFSFLALFGIRKPDVVVAETDPPILAMLVGVYAKMVRAKFVFYINDLYPDIGIALKKIGNPVWLKLLNFATQYGFKHADRVVVLGDDMKRRVIENGCDPAKVELIRCWVDTDLITPKKESNHFRDSLGFTDDDFIVMYSGNLGLSQGLEEVLHAASHFQDHQDIHFLFVGEGATKSDLRLLHGDLRLNGQIKFLPYQDKEYLSESLSAADLHLIPMKQGAEGAIVPSKVYGIMAAGTPYLAIMDKSSDIAVMAEKHSAGMWVEPGSTEDIVEQIRKAYRNREKLKEYGENGRKAAERHYNRPLSMQKFHNLFESLITRRP